MFLEDLNQNISLLGFQRLGLAQNYWRHSDLPIDIQGNRIGTFLPNDTLAIQIWEDVWLARKEQVLQNISALVNPLKSVFARDTRMVPISAEAAKTFLDANHLMGFSKGALFLGCVVPPHRQFRGITSTFQWDGNPLLAVAVFGKPIAMNEKGLEGELSGELIKLATLPTIRLVGGLTKFLEHYRLIQPVHNVMTYIDLDWNTGKGFLAIGFKVLLQTLPLFFKLVGGKRKQVAIESEADMMTKGNLKLRYTYAN
jgi:hypothetical protein